MPMSDLPVSSSVLRIRGDIVASVKDDYGDILVIDDKAWRILSFNRTCEQSKIQKSAPALPIHNYIRAMLMALAMTHADSVLILGLGAGCLVRALHNHDAQCVIDVVELRPAVLDIARRYFSLPQATNIQYFTENAHPFVARLQQPQYNLIFSDLYGADAMSPVQAMDTFLDNCATALLPGGWLVMNYPTLPKANSAVMNFLTGRFCSLLYCTTPSGNVVIYAGKAHCDVPLDRLRRQAQQIGHSINCDISILAKNLNWMV